MSQFGKSFDRAQRAYDNQSPPEDNYPDALDDALPCPCGGEARYEPAGRKADIARITCSNRRCGRIIPIGDFRTTEQGVQLWNLDVRQDSCDPHSYFANVNGPGYHCAHCHKTFTEKEL